MCCSSYESICYAVVHSVGLLGCLLPGNGPMFDWACGRSARLHRAFCCLRVSVRAESGSGLLLRAAFLVVQVSQTFGTTVQYCQLLFNDL